MEAIEIIQGPTTCQASLVLFCLHDEEVANLGSNDNPVSGADWKCIPNYQDNYFVSKHYARRALTKPIHSTATFGRHAAKNSLG